MKIYFVYSNRAEYSILEPFIRYFKKKCNTNSLNLNQKIKNLHLDKNLSKIYSTCYNLFQKNRVDCICVLGDRREIPFVVLAALFSNTKIIHLAAGEFSDKVTTYDQMIRPSVSIMSDMQITFSKEANEIVKNLFKSIPYLRVNTHMLGNPVFTGIQKNKLRRLIVEPYDLVLIHPQSLSKKETERDVNSLKNKLTNKKTIVIYGNKDKHANILNDFYKKIKLKHSNYEFFDTLPTKEYFSLVKYCDIFYTNTSSISEIKYLNKNCLNVIGNRNKNRSNHMFSLNAPEKMYRLLKSEFEK